MAEVRGSDQLLRRTGKAIGDKEIEVLLATVRRVGGDITRWFPYGIPAVEKLTAAVQVSPERVGDLITGVLGIDALQAHSFRIFPRGIPPVELVMAVEMELSAQA